MRAMLRALLAISILAACFAAPALAISRSTFACAEVRTTGSDTFCGGCFYGNGLTTALSGAPTVSFNTAAGTVADGTYYVRVCYSNPLGDGPMSTAQATVVVVGVAGAAQIVVISPPAQTYATCYTVYIGTTSGGPYFLQGTVGATAIGSTFTRTTTPATTGAQARGVDRSQQTSAQVSIDNATIVASSVSGTITFVSGYTPSANDVGNIVYCTGGTGATTGFFEILGWDATTWTISTNEGGAGIGVSAGITAYMGGALATPGLAAKALCTSSSLTGIGTVWINAGTYSMTSTTANVSGGKITAGGVNGTTSMFSMIGYSAARADGGTRPVIQTNQTSFVMLAPGSFTRVENVTFDPQSASAVDAISATNVSQCQFVHVKVMNARNGFALSGGSPNGTYLESCEATVCTTAAISVGGSQHFFSNCEAHGNTCTGFANVTGSVVSRCISYANTGASSDGFAIGAAPLPTAIGCVSYANGRYGFNVGSGQVKLFNCVADGNASDGFFFSVSNDPSTMWNCAGYGNGGTGNYTAQYLMPNHVVGFLALGADPFTAPGSGDFSLNGAATGGALLKGAGYPSSFPAGTTSARPDVGAAQASGGGGASGPAGDFPQ